MELIINDININHEKNVPWSHVHFTIFYFSFEYRLLQMCFCWEGQPQLRGPLPQQHDERGGQPGVTLHGRQEGQGRTFSCLGLHQSDWELWYKYILNINLKPCR